MCLDERRTPVLGVTGEISPDVLHWSKVSRLSGLQGPVSSGGEDLLITEIARIYEALGREPSLSEHFYCTGLAYRVIMDHGTAWVKVSQDHDQDHHVILCLCRRNIYPRSAPAT